MTENRNSTAPVWTDPDDAPDLSSPEWQAKLAVVKPRRGRPKAETPKAHITLRVDADVLASYKASGSGWQTRMNEALRRGIRKA